MKIIAIEKELPDSTPEKFKELSEHEALEAWNLYQAGFVGVFILKRRKRK